MPRRYRSRSTKRRRFGRRRSARPGKRFRRSRRGRRSSGITHAFSLNRQRAPRTRTKQTIVANYQFATPTVVTNLTASSSSSFASTPSDFTWFNAAFLPDAPSYAALYTYYRINCIRIRWYYDRVETATVGTFNDTTGEIVLASAGYHHDLYVKYTYDDSDFSESVNLVLFQQRNNVKRMRLSSGSGAACTYKVYPRGMVPMWGSTAEDLVFRPKKLGWIPVEHLSMYQMGVQWLIYIMGVGETLTVEYEYDISWKTQR